MDVILKELERAFRSLSRSPGSAIIAAVVLSLGIGLSGFMFNFVYGVYLRGLDIAEPDRVMVVRETRVEENQLRRNISLLNFVDLKERQTMFADLLAYQSGQTINVAGTDAPIRLQGSEVSANSFGLLGVAPALGRVFVEGDDAPGAPPLLILGHGAWQDQFGADPSVIGREVRVHGEPGMIIGVMPEGFAWPNNTDGWLPLRDDPLAAERNANFVGVWGRLRPDATPDLAAMELEGIARQLVQEYPDVNEGMGFALYTPVEVSLNDQINSLFATMAMAVVLVLLVACANVGSLLLARATLRTREAGIRTALGASRWRVALPFVSEAAALSAVGAVVGLAITWLVTTRFDQATAELRPWHIRFGVEWPTILFLIAMVGLTALLAALAPAFHLMRTDVNSVLKDESRGSSSRSAGRLTRVLVTAEVAFSCLLLVGAALMVGSMSNLGSIDYPFETEGVFTARIGLNATDYPDPESRARFWSDLMVSFDAESGIAASSLAHVAPYAQGGSGPSQIPVSIDGVDYGDSDERASINRVVVAPGFFETYGVELQAGRDFRPDDDGDAERVAIVNQPMVDRYFSGQNPIGQRFREGISDTLPPVTVIGVVPDLHIQPPFAANFGEYEPAGYYAPLGQHDYNFLTIVARSRGDASSSVPADLRRAVGRVDADIPIYWVVTQQEGIEQSTAFVGTFGSLFVVFGIAALFMASVGLYGVLSFGVARRTSEMGIRMALGADAGQVVRLVLGQGARQLAVGLGLGLAAAIAAAPLLRFILFDVQPRDPLVLLSVTLVIVGVGLLASFVPARRATAVDPIEALRSE